MNCSISPICLFVYNRPDETKKAITALQLNFLASKSDLYIFSDGPKNYKDSLNVKSVRDYISSVSGFKSITISSSEENKGLANSVIDGISKIIALSGKVIALEDDLITTPNFLNFMNQALDFYEKDKQVFSISGYSSDLQSLSDYNKDYYVNYRASSWGWGTWIDRWSLVDWEVKTYPKFKYNIFEQIRFMRGGSDLPRMLKMQMKGKINSWAIRWCYCQFLYNMITINASKSKLDNIGFNINATHNKRVKKAHCKLDKTDKENFIFDVNPTINNKLIVECRKIFSFSSRFKNKFLLM